jgi:hypothetical protein
MRVKRAAAGIASAAIASVAVLSGCGATQHAAVPVRHTAKTVTAAIVRHAAPRPAAKHTAPPADPSLAWLESAGGQAQVTFNDDVDNLAAALQAESHAPTVANHLVFEAAARVVRTEARKILRTRALLPAVNRAAYQRMLDDFIAVANLLQPGPGYGTTAQDETAWYKALHATNIDVY